MRRKTQGGLTLVELIVAFTIMMMLTSMAVPLARYKVQRDKERDLERALVQMRNAIDKFKDDMDAQKIGPAKLDSDNYPENSAATGGRNQSHRIGGQEDEIPAPHPQGSHDQLLRMGSPQRPRRSDSQSWGGQNVFDVYTKSMDKARDGTPYAEW